MKLIARFACAAALLAALVPIVGCDDDDDDNPVTPGTQQARVMAVNAVTGAPSVDVLVDWNVVAPGLAFLGNTTYLTLTPGTRNVRVNLAGTTTTVAEANLLVPGNQNRTVFLVNNADTAEAVLVSDDLTAPAAGQAKVRFVNLGSDVDTVDVAVQGGAVMFANSSFKGSTNFQTMAPGTYALELRDHGKTTVVVPAESVTFEAGGIYTVFVAGMTGGIGAEAVGLTVVRHN